MIKEGGAIIKKISFAVLLILVLAGTVMFFAMIQMPAAERSMDFSAGWSVKHHGVEYKGVDLDKFRLPGGVKKGDLISLKNYLPADLKDGTALVFPLALSTISVDVDGMVLYGYGSKEYAAGEMVGSAVHVVRIPDVSEGKPVSIVVRVGEDGAFTYFSKVVLDDTSWGFTDYLNDNIYPVVVSISLITGGVVILIISLFLALRRVEWVRINQIGMLFFTVGCWNFCEIHAIQIFSVQYSWNTYARYFFGYLSVLPIMRIISSAHKEKPLITTILQKIIFYSVQMLVVGIVAVTFFGSYHICNASNIFQITLCVSMIMLFILEWKDDRGNEILMNGRFREQLVCFLFIGIEAVRFIANRIYNFQSRVIQHSFLLYGTVLLVMMMLGSYVYELYEGYVRQAEEKALKRLAYTDGLTGLLNRSFCKDKMEELDKGKKEYHMISFDVDNLKIINDSKGHQAGDRLLITFADILSRCFSDVGFVIRPGGDEFLVISDDAAKSELMSRLSWLKSLQKNAEKTIGIPVSVAYGLAGRNEVQGRTSEEVYSLADHRMYEMKMKRNGAAKTG